jgi:hypothetical protein
MAESRWFAAVLLFQSQVGTGWEDEAIVHHEVRIIRATSADEAYRRAQALGAKGQHSYPNAAGEDVAWHFLGLAELEKLVESPADGSEVYSWLTRGRGENLVREKDDLEAFLSIENRHRRAEDLLNE